MTKAAERPMMDDMILVVMWLFWLPIGAGIGAAIGSSKGQTLAGAVLGGLLGIIGWIVVAFMSPSPAVQYERDQRQAATMRAALGGIGNMTGWHPDPLGRHELRWWDGRAWADFVCDAGVTSTDRLVPA